MLEEYSDEAMIIAGGTDLLVCMKQGTAAPIYLIGLRSVANLDNIRFVEGEGLYLGSLVTHQSIASNFIVREKFPSLQVACSKVGTPQIRNMGTVGGNLCNAAPSADSAPALIALGASVQLISSQGKRTVSVEEFFVGPGKTVLKPGEILSELLIPVQGSNSGTVYIKLPARTAVDIATVGVAASITLDSNKEGCVDARIALGAVAPTPIRAKRAEDILKNHNLEDVLVREAAELASSDASPISDVRSSADYRVEMVKVLTREAICRALESARNKDLEIV